MVVVPEPEELVMAGGGADCDAAITGSIGNGLHSDAGARLATVRRWSPAAADIS